MCAHIKIDSHKYSFTQESDFYFPQENDFVWKLIFLASCAGHNSITISGMSFVQIYKRGQNLWSNSSHSPWVAVTQGCDAWQKGSEGDCQS